ncbi:LCP family protein [Micromonospora sp. CPCC 206060]|uniref:LCP family protein n=1 Tax=Micromonospora sp. CPCC 206060 TaxID=3122406 RepID=UPI002FF1EEA6
MTDVSGGRLRRRRTRALVGVAVVLALLAAAGCTGGRSRGGGDGPSATPTGTAGTPTPSPTPSPTPPPGAGLTGPLNFLLVGLDTRISVPGWEPHADAVLVMHVPAGLDRAYLFSLPRDLVVDIPAFPAAGFPGQRTKLTHAMSYGSRVPGRRDTPDPAQGYQLLATTVSRYTGIDRFDGGAMLTFGGFDNLVDAIGGVDLTIDQRVVSRHRQPDGKHRRAVPGGYTGPQMVYEPGPAHLNGWQAIDYARQRYITGGDYARQRHQQQLIRAMVRQIQSDDLARDPDRVDRIVRSLGRAMTFVGDGHRLVDFAYALGGLRPDALTLVGLPGRSVGSGAGYRGEQLDPVGRRFLTELRAGRVGAFLAANPKLVIQG